MQDHDRLASLARLIREGRITNQSEIKQGLLSVGVETTQSSISRDLKKLGVIKVDGVYRMPSIAPGESSLVDKLDVRPVSDCLIVIKTGPGNANRAAVLIDEQKISGILGTIAGDDTIFLAVENRSQQAAVMRKIISIFG